ncbi:MAG: hypothetical protein JWN65_143 [Solirubrobacterales bacterium]|nr:hypothetical protein [Solirubrobacterales bacterium]
MTITRRLAVLAVVPCASAALTGCATTIKEKDLESKIAQNLEGQLTSTRVTVDCPRGKEAKQGNVFTCKTVIGGRPAVVDVRLLDDKGRFSFRVHSPKTTR